MSSDEDESRFLSPVEGIVIENPDGGTVRLGSKNTETFASDSDSGSNDEGASEERAGRFSWDSLDQVTIYKGGDPNNIVGRDPNGGGKSSSGKKQSSGDEKASVRAADSDSSSAGTSGESGKLTMKLAPLDTRSGDGRMIGKPAGGEVRTRQQMWLLHQPATGPAHDGAVPVGRIDRAWVDGDALMGEAQLDMADDTAREVHRKIRDGFAGTISVDLDDAEAEERFYNSSGEQVTDFAAANPEELHRVLYVKDWRLGGATLVPHPAFHDANVSIAAEGAGAGEGRATTGGKARAEQRSTTASASDRSTWAQSVAEVAWNQAEPHPDCFADPQLSGPTKVQVTEDARVFGHVAAWSTDHISYPGRGVKPPRSETNYAQFHRHPIRCSDQSKVRTGVLVMGTGHADLNMSESSASAHYDHTGHIVADVRAGEDEHGIWIAGALHPDITPLQVTVLDRYSLSGDWRGGELVAALVVNVPGFPLPENDALAASGELTLETPKLRSRTDAYGDSYALVASGIVTPEQPVPHDQVLAEIRQLRDELRAQQNDDIARRGMELYRAQQDARRVDQRVSSAFDRIHGSRLERITDFARRRRRGRDA